jgi:glucodextranase-like protein
MHADTRLSRTFLCRAAVLLALAFALAACGGGGEGAGGGGGGPDTTPPDTSITSSPPPLTNQRSASFAFSSSEANSTFEISVDGGAFSIATSPFQAGNLGDGQHVLAVRARDAAGNVDPTPASVAWTVDTQVPDTSMTSSPPPLTNQRSASFAFSSSEANSTFEISVDGGAFSIATSPFQAGNLGDGQHVLAVRARDAAGNADPTPASVAWTVDTLVPDTSLTSATPPITNSTSASFQFASSKPASFFEASIDGSAFAPRTSPLNLSGLADGPHTVQVRALDAATNVDPTPASFAWTVDTQPPDTTITSTPVALANSASASFQFASSEPNSSFEVSVDGGAFSPRTSPLTLAGLSEGLHSISVRAVDAAANPDPTPASFAWTVDLTAPAAKIVFPTRISYTDGDRLAVRGSAADANGISGVTVNGVAATTSDGFATWRASVPIETGQNTVSVSVTDRAGNTRAGADSVQVRNSGTPLGFVVGMDMDTSRILAFDSETGTIWAVDRSTGKVSILSDVAHGTGPLPQSIEGIAVNAAGNRVLVADGSEQDALLAVDLSNGNRTALTTFANSSFRTRIALGTGVALDAANNAVYVAAQSGIGVVRIDLGTGARTVVSSTEPGATIGTGDATGSGDMVFDDATNASAPRLLVLAAQKVTAVDIATGNRTTLSGLVLGSNVGSGPSFVSPQRMKLDAAHGRLLVADNGVNALMTVDLASGDRATLVGSLTPTAVNLLSVALDAATSHAFVAPLSHGDIIDIDLGTLNRSLFASSRVGSGAEIAVVDGLGLRPGSDSSLLLLDSDQHALFDLDLATGIRSQLSGPSAGGGPPFADFPVVLSMDAAAPRALVMDNSGNLFAVDPASGDRTLIAAGPGSVGPRGMAYDAGNNRVFFTSFSGALAMVDLATGVMTDLGGRGGNSVPIGVVIDSVTDPASPRPLIVDFGDKLLFALNPANLAVTTVSGGSPFGGFVGAGPLFLRPSNGVLDAGKRRVLVSDDKDRLLAVDLANGNRSLVSGRDTVTGATTGGGPSLYFPRTVDADFSKGIAYVASRGYLAVMAVDLITGERVVIAR